MLLLDECVADLRVGCIGLEGADHPRSDLGVAARIKRFLDIGEIRQVLRPVVMMWHSGRKVSLSGDLGRESRIIR